MSLIEYTDLEQRSEEWFEARRGIVTASAIGQLITIGSPGAVDYECPTCSAAATFPCVSVAKGKPAEPIKTNHPARAQVAADSADQAPPVLTVADTDTAKKLIEVLVAERVSGFTESTPITFDMFRGLDCEPIARDFYAGHHAEVTECGFMRREEDGWTLGWSPDGLVGDDGAIEVKSPRASTHVRTIIADEVPSYCMAQCQAALVVSGRSWIDFVSFVGGLPFWVKRVYPDPVWRQVIIAAARRFEDHAADMEATYRAKVAGLPIPERVTNYGEIEAA